MKEEFRRDINTYYKIYREMFRKGLITKKYSKKAIFEGLKKAKELMPNGERL